MAWTLIDPSPQVAATLNLPDRVPVREDRVDDIIGGDRVDLGALCLELDAACAENPTLVPILGPGVSRLAVLAANDAIAEQLWTIAEHYARTGLIYDPENMSLRVRMSNALHGQQRHADALDPVQA